MPHRFRFALSLILPLVFVSTATAQWIDYKTPGLPRTPDGTPHLTAPRPTAPNGTPDLSGLWRFEAKSNPGSLIDAAGPQPWIVDAARKFMHELGRDDTGVHCLPSGPRALHSMDFAKFVQTPSLITVLYESMAFRQIFLDGRPLPTDPNPSWLDTKFMAQGVAVEFMPPDAKGIVSEVVVTIVEGEFKAVRVK